jgi:hypothetical protein
MPVILAIWETETERISAGGQPGQIVFKTPNSRAKWTGGMTQMVEHLLCKYEALTSNPSPTKKRENK